jgi:hypothetical protein
MEEESKYTSGLIVLTPPESKRLIAKAIARMPEVQLALEEGCIIIGTGTTNAYVAEELLGPCFEKEDFLSGHVIDGAFGKASAGRRYNPFVLRKGEKVEEPWQEALRQFEADDVFIKGANAVDSEGYAGILIGHPVAGTIGAALPVVTARGSHLIMPVGLEKMIPSVIDAAEAYAGIKRIEHTLDNYPVGFFPVVNANVVTEIQALEEMYAVEATHIASGGIAGSEGAVTILIEGLSDDVVQCMEFVKSIKGEPLMKRPS